MRTFDEIEERKNELARMFYSESCSEEKQREIEREMDALDEEELLAEMQNDMECAEAVAQSENVMILVNWKCECWYAVSSRINGEWDYADGLTATQAMERFAKLARESGVKKCLVKPEFLDRDFLKSEDERLANYRDSSEYEDACMASACGDDSLMNSYNRRHGVEKDYGPSNPWDAPGMSVGDFI